MKYFAQFEKLLILILLGIIPYLNTTNSSEIPTQKILKLSSEEIANLEMKQFQLEKHDFILELREEEEEKFISTGNTAGGRVKRTVIYNAEALMHVTFVFAIPVTVMLPILTNVFNNLNWGKIFKGKRSLPDQVIQEAEGEEEFEELIEESVLVQPHLDKITGYFELMKIPKRSCQERAICEFSADPSKYYPVSELILQRLHNPYLPSISYNLEENNLNLTRNANIKEGQKKKQSLYEKYTKAAEKGLAYGENVCSTDFLKKCPFPIEKRLNMKVLQFWNLLSSLLKFNINDKIDATSSIF